MKLILNKNSSGNDELKKLLGFLDRSIGFDNLERFVKNSTQDLINLIGKDTYNLIQADYAADEQEHPVLIEAAQYSIAIDAYRRYAPSKDVGHTQNGRRMRIDDHEKQAFEWMIDRDNENMERMFYQSLDLLLIALEGLQVFMESDNYKKLNELFVCKTSDFDDYFNINSSRYLLMKLQPGLRQAERQGILPRIGKPMFDTLKEDRSSDPELLDLVKEACVYWAMSWAMKGRLTVTLFPEGVLQRYVGDRITSQGKKPAALNESAWAAQQFMLDAEDVLKRISEKVAPAEAPSDPTDTDVGPGFGFTASDTFIST